jgi:hypothetical protein
MVNDLDYALMFSVSTIEMINSEIYKETNYELSIKKEQFIEKALT